LLRVHEELFVPSLEQHAPAGLSGEGSLNPARTRADPVIKIAIEPKSKGDLEKMGNGLYKLAQEDPSFHYTRDEETNQTVIEGMGELHLDIIVDRLRREYKARAGTHPPDAPSPSDQMRLHARQAPALRARHARPHHPTRPAGLLVASRCARAAPRRAAPRSRAWQRGRRSARRSPEPARQGR